MAIMAIFDNNGSPRDTAVFMILWGPFAAWSVVAAIDLIRSADLHTDRMRTLLTGVAFAILLAVGFADSVDHRRFLESQNILYVADQARMAESLSDALVDGDEVLSLSNFWYQVLTGRDNLLPITKVDPRVPVNDLAGWDVATIEGAILRERPVVIMGWARANSPSQAVDEVYQYVGSLSISHDQPSQPIWVDRDRPDIVEIIEGWPLED
jgi:hypothetical protein